MGARFTWGQLVMLFALSLSLHAQVFQLGSASDPCTGGTIYATPPLRFGSIFSCTIPATGSNSVQVTVKQPIGASTTAGDWKFTISTGTVSQAVTMPQAPGAPDVIVAMGTYSGPVTLTFTATQRNALASVITLTPASTALGMAAPIMMNPPLSPGPCPTTFLAMAVDAAGYLYVCGMFTPGQWVRFGPGVATWQ